MCFTLSVQEILDGHFMGTLLFVDGCVVEEILHDSPLSGTHVLLTQSLHMILNV